MTRIAFASLFVVGCTSSSTPIGITPQPDNTLSFPLGSISANRYSAMCGVANPPFQDSDLYSLSLVGADLGVPRTVIEVSFHPTIPHASDLAVTLGAFGILGYEIGPDGSMQHIQYGQQGPFATASDDTSFTWGQGADASQVDATPLDSATLRLDGLEGNDFSLGIDLRFHDSGVLDIDVGAKAFAGESGCPAG
jgi:hypothetical protein